MPWLWLLVVVLVPVGSLLASAETSISRITRVRAMALRAAGRRNAEALLLVKSDPTPHLNAIYLCVMFAILVAILVEHTFGQLRVSALSFPFTLAYFVVVEAMSKTFGILHSASVALALAPVVLALGRTLRLPTRLLIGLGNVLLPVKGLREGPFVTPEEIRSMAELGREEGTIGEQERGSIHSVFELGDTLVREVMVPRPDVVAVPRDARAARGPRPDAPDLGTGRIPVYRGMPPTCRDVYGEDVLDWLRSEQATASVEARDAPALHRSRDHASDGAARPDAGAAGPRRHRRGRSTARRPDWSTSKTSWKSSSGRSPRTRTRPSSRSSPTGPYRVSAGLAVRALSETLGVGLSEDGRHRRRSRLRRAGKGSRAGETVRCAEVRFTIEEVSGGASSTCELPWKLPVIIDAGLPAGSQPRKP